jgi:hypothetical protein
LADILFYFLSQARIDLDQQYVNNAVDLATQDTFQDARKVYEKGAFSKSVASIVLSQALGSDVPAGAVISGRSESGSAVAGVALNALTSSYVGVHVQYVSEGCYVGGLATTNPVTDGCKCCIM